MSTTCKSSKTSRRTLIGGPARKTAEHDEELGVNSKLVFLAYLSAREGAYYNKNHFGAQISIA